MNLTGMETARTLAKGENRFNTSYSWVFDSPKIYTIGDNGDPYFPQLIDVQGPAIDYTFGLGKRMDMKIYSEMVGSLIGLRTKYRLSKADAPLSYAIGGGMGYSGGGPFLDFITYLSYHPFSSDNFAVYISPKYRHLFLQSNIFNEQEVPFYGANMGVMAKFRRLDIVMDFGRFGFKVKEEGTFDFGNMTLGLGWRF